MKKTAVGKLQSNYNIQLACNTNLQQVAVLLEIQSRIHGVRNEQGQHIGGHRLHGQPVRFVHKKFMIDAYEN